MGRFKDIQMANDPFLIDPMEWFQFLDNDNPSEDFGFQITAKDIKKYCEHKWVNQGFMHEKLCCKLCDISKEDWETFCATEKVKKEDSVYWR